MRFRSLCVPALMIGFVGIPTSFVAAAQGQRAGTNPSAPATNEQGTSPQVQILQLRDTVSFSAPPPSGFMPGMKCDAGSEIFARFPRLNPQDSTLFNSPVSRLSLDSGQVVAYGLSPQPDPNYPNESWENFDVDQRGTVYALILSWRLDPKESRNSRTIRHYYIQRFKDDGTADSIVELKPPAGTDKLLLFQFGVFSGGNFLVTGDAGNGPESLQPFTAIYDSKGRFVNYVSLPDDVTPKDYMKPKSREESSPKGRGINNPEDANSGNSQAEQETQASHISETDQAAGSFEFAVSTGSIFSGPDGNVYLLRNSRPLKLYILDSTGSVVENFRIAAPVAGLVPFNMGPGGSDQIFFDFEAAPPGSGQGALTRGTVANELIGNFNTLSGQFEALYELPESARRKVVPACADQRGGFLYLGTTADRQHLAVYRYVP